MGEAETKSLGHHQQRRPPLQRSYSVKPRRESSWQSLKAASFRVANAVVLPKNQRTVLPEGHGSRTSSLKNKSRSLVLQPIKRLRVTPSEPPTPDGEAFLQAPAFPGPSSRARALLPILPDPHNCETKPAEDECADEDHNVEVSNGLRSLRVLDDKFSTEDGQRAQQDDDMPLMHSEVMSSRSFPRLLPRMISELPTAPDEPPMSKTMPLSISLHDLSDKIEEEEYYVEDEEDEDLAYNNHYNCFPPPIFMFCITMAELGFFIYHTRKLLNDPKYGYVNKYGPAPLDSRLIYDPRKRNEFWRYLTYALVHSGYMHIINNVVIQIVLGVLLEMVHKWWRVLAIYFAGVLFGSFATSIAEPFNYLAGASAGVYALIAAHLSTVILNWNEMEYPWLRVLLFVAFLFHDAGTAFYITFVTGETTNVGYACHLGGAVAGLLVGIHVLKNLQWRKWEEILWYFCSVLCILLFAFAVLWNIFRADLFP